MILPAIQTRKLPHGVPAGNAMNLRRFVACVLVAGCFGSRNLSGAEKAPPPTEAELKAALLVKLAGFIVWPESAFGKSRSQFEIGVLGTNPFGTFLNRHEDKKIHGDRALKIRYASTASELKDCHVVFIASQHEGALGSILKVFEGRPVLIVGEEPGFAMNGGMINLLIREEKPYLEINARTAELAGLKFRGQLGSPKSVRWVVQPSVQPPSESR